MFKNKWKKKFEEEAWRNKALNNRLEDLLRDYNDLSIQYNTVQHELHERNKVRFTDAGTDYPRRESATSASNREDYFDQSQVVRTIQEDDQIKYVLKKYTHVPGERDEDNQRYRWRI